MWVRNERDFSIGPMIGHMLHRLIFSLMCLCWLKISAWRKSERGSTKSQIDFGGEKER